MRIIAIKTIKDFWEDNRFKDSEQSLRAWYFEVKKAEWKSPNDVRKKYKNASFVGNNRIIFNIKGNKYRLIVAVRYDKQIIFIRFVGNHDKYNKIDAKNI